MTMVDRKVNEMSEELMQIAIEKEALLNGHFLLSSGLHSQQYFQCAKLLQWPNIAKQFGEALEKIIVASLPDGMMPDVILAPAMGGLFIGNEVARAFDTRSIFLERVNNVFELKRGFEIRPNENVIIIEDVLTTGKSTLEVVDYIQANTKGNIIAIGCLANRMSEENHQVVVEQLKAKLGRDIPFSAVLRILAAAWPESECPECKTTTPLVKPGSRKI
ncbi:MAG: orotate phosphoribosyltransferase [Candidatus Omnitrophota bacterium]|jgi:orotate phosphoribosyltransferase